MTSVAERRGRLTWALVACGVAAACSAEPTNVPPLLEVVIASGDGQFGVIGQNIASPLRVVVRAASTGSPRSGVSVLWNVTSGDAMLIGVTTTVTDSTGSSEVRVRLGATEGKVSVMASVAEQPSATATFQLFGVGQPTLVEVVPTSADPGATVTLTGTNFSSVEEQNVVLFSGVRGRVLSASRGSLQVEVPRCLPPGDVGVRVQLGIVASDSLPLTIIGGGEVTELELRDFIDISDPGGFECYTVPGGLGVRYLTIVYAASTVGAASHPFELTALGYPGPAAVSAAAGTAEPQRVSAAETDPQASWDEHVRELERALIRDGSGQEAGAPGPARVGPEEVPVVGERRTFSVLNAQNDYDQITAVAEYVGARGAIFVDEDAPDQGFDIKDLKSFADRFDDVIYPEDTETFGMPSDLDGNERVIILFTPAVNALTPRGSSGFVGGFFFGNDLLPDKTNSNQGEIFYALVPDPLGQFSDVRQTSTVLTVVPAILAHEFQHMIHFNQRILLRGADSQEAVWLSEALAQMAEELVARAYDDLLDPSSGELFRSGVRARSRTYLEGPDSVSLVVTTGRGSLAERGAGFLHLLYLEDQEGEDLLRRLTQSTRTGVANVEAEVGRSWPEILADWWSAVYLDGAGPETGPLVYPTVDLRGFFGSSFPLVPTAVGPEGLAASGLLLSSAAGYYRLRPARDGSITLRLGGEAGGPSAVQSDLRMRVIRVQ